MSVCRRIFAALALCACALATSADANARTLYSGPIQLSPRGEWRLVVPVDAGSASEAELAGELRTAGVQQRIEVWIRRVPGDSGATGGKRELFHADAANVVDFEERVPRDGRYELVIRDASGEGIANSVQADIRLSYGLDRKLRRNLFALAVMIAIGAALAFAFWAQRGRARVSSHP